MTLGDPRDAPAGARNRPRGRPRRDPVEECRARTWYWLVRSRSELSDYALNHRFIEASPKGGAPKAFDRVRKHGVVPTDATPPDSDRKARSRRDYSLVERVDQEPSFHGTAAVFRAPFWRVVSHPTMDVQDIRAIVKATSEALGLLRPDLLHAKRLLGDDLQSPLYAETHMLAVADLARRACIDSLGLLASLFREALLFAELDLCILLREGFQSGLHRYADRMIAYVELPHLAQFKPAIERDAFRLVNVAIDRVVHSRQMSDKVDLLDDPRIPVLEKELLADANGRIPPRLSIQFVD